MDHHCRSKGKDWISSIALVFGREIFKPGFSEIQNHSFFFLIMNLFWLHQVLVAALGIFPCIVGIFHYGAPTLQLWLVGFGVQRLRSCGTQV